MKDPREKYISIMTDGENVWEFVRMNCDDDAVFERIRDMVKAALQFLKERDMGEWPGGFQLSRIRELSLEDGRTIDAYCFEYNAWPGFKPGMTEEEKRQSTAQLISFPCFLRLDENRKIVEYIEAVRQN